MSSNNPDGAPPTRTGILNAMYEHTRSNTSTTDLIARMAEQSSVEAVAALRQIMLDAVGSNDEEVRLRAEDAANCIIQFGNEQLGDGGGLRLLGAILRPVVAQ